MLGVKIIIGLLCLSFAPPIVGSLWAQEPKQPTCEDNLKIAIILYQETQNELTALKVRDVQTRLRLAELERQAADVKKPTAPVAVEKGK